MSTKKKSSKQLPHVIVRAAQAGVFAGELVEHDRKTQTAVLKNARRLWYWSGAASLSQAAVSGFSHPSACKFPVAVAHQLVAGVIEILTTTEDARKSIDAVPVWKA